MRWNSVSSSHDLSPTEPRGSFGSRYVKRLQMGLLALIRNLGKSGYEEHKSAAKRRSIRSESPVCTPVPCVDLPLGLNTISKEQFREHVVECLRAQGDFAFLGNHTMASLLLVQQKVKEQGGALEIGVDRGKALYEVLVDGILKLCPEEPQPPMYSRILPQWRKYLILRGNFVEHKDNDRLMAELLIGEAQFFRDKRKAITNLSNLLWDLEKMHTL